MENDTQSQMVLDLVAARDSLTLETWHKGSYFLVRDDSNGGKTLCMCAHGALQRVINPKCKAATPKAGSGMGVFAYAEALARRAANDSIQNKGNILQAWKMFPVGPYGRTTSMLHYILGLVGLTGVFNDNPDTTLEMVKSKFDEAIELVKLLESNNLI
jgi:hypothetical protein